MTENVNTSSDYLTEDEEYQVNETEYHSRTDQWKIITVFTSVFMWLKSWFVPSQAKEPLRRSARYGFFLFLVWTSLFIIWVCNMYVIISFYNIKFNIRFICSEADNAGLDWLYLSGKLYKWLGYVTTSPIGKGRSN